MHSIRNGTEDDVAKLAALDKRLQDNPWTEAHFRDELEKKYSTTLLMTDDETDEFIAAYIVFWLQAEECEILTVGVDPKLRRLGLAQQLVEMARKLALQAGAKRMVLNVRKSNEPAISLYQKLHFAIEHVRKRFYSNGEDAYEMVVMLDQKGSLSTPPRLD